MEPIRFTVPGEPKGKARARTVMGSSGVHSFTPSGTVCYENMVRFVYQQLGVREPFPQHMPLHVRIKAYLPIPKSTSLKKRKMMEEGQMQPTKKPDADNISKIILDALNHIAYHDDSQVVELEVFKLYSDNPRAEVEIIPV